MAEAQLSQDDGQAAVADGDAALRQLVSEHQALDRAVRQLSSLTYLSLDEQLKEAALKKRKLALKDRIQAMARDRGRPGG